MTPLPLLSFLEVAAAVTGVPRSGGLALYVNDYEYPETLILKDLKASKVRAGALGWWERVCLAHLGFHSQYCRKGTTINQ